MSSYGPIITSLSDDELFETYQDIQEYCEICKTAHHSCKVHRWDCEKCEWLPFKVALSNYFEN